MCADWASLWSTQYTSFGKSRLQWRNTKSHQKKNVSSNMRKMHGFRCAKYHPGIALHWCILSLILLADTEGPDQSARTCRLILAFPVSACQKTRFRMAQPIFIRALFSSDVVEKSLDKQLKLWKSRLFLKPTSYNADLIPLSEVLQSKCLSLHQCVQITAGIARCLHILHSQSIIQTHLSTKSIRLKITDSVSHVLVIADYTVFQRKWYLVFPLICLLFVEVFLLYF